MAHSELNALLFRLASLPPTSICPLLPPSRNCPDGSSALHIAAIQGSLRAVHAIISEFMLSVSPERQAGLRTWGLPEHSMVDPRLLVDCDNNTAFVIARRRRQFDLLPLLNPFTPLSRVFDSEAPEERLVGVPTLLQLAAKVRLAALSLIHYFRTCLGRGAMIWGGRRTCTTRKLLIASQYTGACS